MGCIGVVAGGVGKDVSSGDSVGCGDDLAHLEMPPHIRVIEALAYRQYRERHEKAGQHRREREDPLHGANAGGLDLFNNGRHCVTLFPLLAGLAQLRRMNLE